MAERTELPNPHDTDRDSGRDDLPVEATFGPNVGTDLDGRRPRVRTAPDPGSVRKAER